MRSLSYAIEINIPWWQRRI